MNIFDKLREKNFDETREKLSDYFANDLRLLLQEGNNKEIKSFALKNFPALSKLLGWQFAAFLVAKAKSLQKLAFMTSSKVQVLGAEKALFRHLKTGSKAPKYGIIFTHEKVSGAKSARKLAAEIVKAARVDYFRK